MKVVVGGRRSGKTRRLIELCAEYGGYMVVRSHREAHRVAQMARELGLRIPFPISHGELLSSGCSAGVRQLWFEEPAAFLSQLTNVPVAGLSIGYDPRQPVEWLKEVPS